MRKSGVIALALAAAAALLVACGGGGSGGSGGGLPGGGGGGGGSAKHVGFNLKAISSLSTRRSAQSGTRRTESLCPGVPSNIELQAVPNASPPPNATTDFTFGNEVTATEYDANCNVVSTAAAYAVNNPSVVATSVPGWVQTQVSQGASPFPSASPGSTFVDGAAQGATQIVATFPDGTTATVPLAVYGTMGVACGENSGSGGYWAYDGTGQFIQAGWSQAAGYIQQSSLNACGSTNQNAQTADIQVTNSGAFGPGGITFANGYELVPADTTAPDEMTALSEIASCASFASAGTQMSVQQVQSLSGQIIIFKTASGACVKLYPQNNSFGVSQNGNAYVAGLYAVSDANGNFAY